MLGIGKDMLCCCCMTLQALLSWPLLIHAHEPGCTAKAAHSHLPQPCFCGRNDNKMPLTQTQSPLDFHSKTSAESTCPVVVYSPSAVGQVCLLTGLSQNSFDLIILCRFADIQSQLVIDQKLSWDRAGASITQAGKNPVFYNVYKLPSEETWKIS